MLIFCSPLLVYSDQITAFEAHRLTYDHKADDIGEQERIKDAGGFVTRGRCVCSSQKVE